MTIQLLTPATSRHRSPVGRLRRLVLGPADGPLWARPALWAVLLLAATLYGWGLSGNGYANSYYSAAVKSGIQSWKAFFFGSLDSASFMTVDKPPMALWVMELAGRLFGFGPWSLLLPQVVMGVATVGLLYATVRRVFGPAAGLIAALVMAVTPITVAINRDNNPDTLLVLLLVLAAWACQRALESGRLRWLLATAFFLGCGFNTKMLQAYLLLPALAMVYLSIAKGGWWRRSRHLLAAGLVLAVSTFWWMIIVDLIPVRSRPYIGGSTNNTVWDLVVGYNGLGRITGGDGAVFGGGRGGGQGASFAGPSGPVRLFNDIVGGQISWLLPFAAIAVIAGTVLYWRRPRTDPARAALLLWGGWLAVHFIVFSFSSGTMHPYYTAALAPAIAALTGIGAVTLFRASRWSRVWGCVLVFGIAATGAWSFAILRRTPSWNPWLGWTVVGLAAVAAIAVLCRLAARLGQRSITRLAVLTAVGGLLAGIAGPAAYAVSAASSRTNGTNPLAGPSAGGFGMGGSGMGGGLPAGGRTSGGRDRAQADGSGGRPGGGGPRMGEIDAQLLSYLEKNQGSATWLVAVSNSQSAASIILQTGEPAISMFGFTGSDHAMTVQTLQEYVKAGKLRYVVIGGGGGFQGGGETASGVTSWVQENCTTVPASVYGEASSSAGNSQTLYRCD